MPPVWPTEAGPKFWIQGPPPEQFRDSVFQGLPVNHLEENLFYAILKNKSLSEREITLVFDILFFELEYIEFREKLFTTSAFDVLLKDERFKNILYSNYVYHIEFGFNYSISREQEYEIWSVLFKTQSKEKLNEILKLLKKDEMIPLNKSLDFTKKWFEHGDTTQEVINIYDKVTKFC